MEDPSAPWSVRVYPATSPASRSVRMGGPEQHLPGDRSRSGGAGWHRRSADSHSPEGPTLFDAFLLNGPDLVLAHAPALRNKLRDSGTDEPPRPAQGHQGQEDVLAAALRQRPGRLEFQQRRFLRNSMLRALAGGGSSGSSEGLPVLPHLVGEFGRG